MPFVTRSELRWSRYISFSNAICKINYRELEYHLTISRCYAINRDIDGDCPGSKRGLKTLATKKCCEGGSRYSENLNF